MTALTAVQVVNAIRADARSDSMDDQRMFTFSSIENLLVEIGAPRLNLQVTPPLVAKVHTIWWKVSRAPASTTRSPEVDSLAAEIRQENARGIELLQEVERLSKGRYRLEPVRYRREFEETLTNPDAKRRFGDGDLILRDLLRFEPLAALFFGHRMK